MRLDETLTIVEEVNGGLKVGNPVGTNAHLSFAHHADLGLTLFCPFMTLLRIPLLHQEIPSVMNLDLCVLACHAPSNDFISPFFRPRPCMLLQVCESFKNGETRYVSDKGKTDFY